MNVMKAVFLGFATMSFLSISSGVFLGLLLILSPSGGGFFPHLGVAIGILVMGAGNLISCLCNGICWWTGKHPRWLAVITLLQIPPAIVVAILILSEQGVFS